MEWDQTDPGKLLDKALDQLDVRFPPDFDPRAYQPRRSSSGMAWKAAVAAGILLALGTLSHGWWASTPGSPGKSLAGRAPTQSPVKMRSFEASPGLPLWVDTNQPAWQLVVTRSSRTGLEVMRAVGNGHPALSVGLLKGRPVFVERGRGPRRSVTTPVGTPLAGSWVAGGNTALDSLAAAGNYIYLTTGNQWAVMNAPGIPSTWNPVPDASATWSWIQALPGAPATAVLLTEDPGGQQNLYWRKTLTGPWMRENLPGSPVTELVAAGDRFWALAGGRLVVSPDAHTWTALFTPPPGFAVTTFAVDPVGSGEIALALAPNQGPGVGPILLSRNDGLTWRTLPPAWPSGRPTSLVLDSLGDVGALMGSPGPVVIERWDNVTGTWQILALPPTADLSRPGLIGALSQGDLVYADAAGHIYVWTLPRGVWHALPRAPNAASVPTLLMGIGTHQVLASYPGTWTIFVTASS
jgi:hypothetical protein